jgi:hypothetical protein
MYTFGGACGHVGFGTLWPDFKAQITYTTPKVGDVFQVSAGIFDPRTVPTRGWTQIKIPRFESEAVASYNWSEGWGFKAWANGAWQRLGNGAEQRDANFELTGIKVVTQDAYGVGGGLMGYLGFVDLGVSGYTGRGMDGFTFLTFNPVLMGLGSGADLNNEDREFRPSTGLLAEAKVTFGDTWVMGGFGQASFERVDSDPALDASDNFPLPAAQRGISAGVFHRMGDVVFGLDYFNAHYDFDPVLVAQDDGTSMFEEPEQAVHFVSGGMTLEW